MIFILGKYEIVAGLLPVSAASGYPLTPFVVAYQGNGNNDGGDDDEGDFHVYSGSHELGWEGNSGL